MNYKKHDPSRQGKLSESSFTVLFEPAAEGGYVVTCPALPGLVTEGGMLGETRKMAKDAILAYLESLRKDGESIPKDPKLISNPLKEKISVTIRAEYAFPRVEGFSNSGLSELFWRGVERRPHSCACLGGLHSHQHLIEFSAQADRMVSTLLGIFAHLAILVA